MPERVRALALVVVSVVVASVACGGAGTPVSSPAGSGGGDPSAREASSAANGPPRSVDCGDFTTCAVVGDGSVRCWGKNKLGELGDGAAVDRAKGHVVSGLGHVKTIAMAAQFACALLEDKTVKCWGTGRIANDGKVFTNAKPVAVAGVQGAEELVASGAVACARTASGVSCWGVDAASIGKAPEGAFKQIAAGFSHACALDAKGAVSCWGPGDWGGGGAFSRPAISGAQHIATGDRHACVVTKDKKVQCWGSNDAGQLGTKPDVDVHKKPVDVPGVRSAVRLVTGEASTCAILEDRSTVCWGSNAEGELGLGRRSSDERPAKVSALSNVVEMCFGSTYGCALTKSESILCWGSNAFGQLGDGSKERRLTPANVVW